MKQNRIWAVTGACGGFGGALVETLLKQGFCVAAMTRTPETLLERYKENENLLVIRVDITHEEQVLSARAKILERFGRVDVVVNAAGYGLDGAIEEVSDAEARSLFNVNLFGMLNICRTFVPDLREQGGGYIINYAGEESIAATAYHAVSHAAQFAIDALTDALNKEAGQFGISAICLKCGPMRTEYLSHKQNAALSLNVYGAIREESSVKDTSLHGKEPVCPQKTAELLIRLTGEEDPPKDLYLSQKSILMARRSWDELEAEFEKWKWATLCVDFPKEDCYYGKRG